MIEYKEHPESKAIINYANSRYKKGKYTLIVAAGEPGTGKSSTCQRLAELISLDLYGINNITIDNFCNDLAEMWEFVLSHMDGTGGIMIAEELSVLFPSVRATSSDNLSAQKLLDTCRKFKIILLGNAPIWKFISGSLRTHAHIYIETIKIIESQQVVIYKMFKLQTNYYSGKVYLHKFTLNGTDLHRGYAGRPNLDIWAEYEKDKIKSAKDMYTLELAKKKMRIEKEHKELQKYNMGVNENDVYDYAILPEKQKQIAERLLKIDKTLTKARRMEILSKENGVTVRAIQDSIRRIKDKRININW